MDERFQKRVDAIAEIEPALEQASPLLQGYEDLASLLGYDGPCVEPRLPLKPDVEPRFPGEVPGPLFL